MEVREQEVDRERPRAAAVHKRGPELAQACARVEDEERSGAVATSTHAVLPP